MEQQYSRWVERRRSQPRTARAERELRERNSEQDQLEDCTFTPKINKVNNRPIPKYIFVPSSVVMRLRNLKSDQSARVKPRYDTGSI